MRKLELLAPAADKEIAIQAILHGADAVYMGGPSHGARKNASNSIEDIAEVVRFAHQFRARVYVTVNTIIYDAELASVEKLIRELYQVGVDALIVQDMSILRMDIPPIQLHASTQCDIRTPQKAKFLQDVGFSQLVLARELSISEIKEIADAVTVPLEFFVHGALCVSYSGRCGASQISMGRSANRGECAQMCRLPYTLRNGKGEVLAKDKYLLSLRDFNMSDKISDLIEAGITSFKIEGRLKDVTYVKNVTAAYRQIIDKYIELHPDEFCRSSYGKSEIGFKPMLSKSFNRGFTHYFIEGRKNGSMASLRTPKSMGESITDIRKLNNGDGISFFNDRGDYEGVAINGVQGNRVIGNRPFKLPKGAVIHRTFDRVWDATLKKETATRKIDIDIEIDRQGITATDERGMMARLAYDFAIETARKPMGIERIFAKLGNTVYNLRNFENRLASEIFIPASQLTDCRRKLISLLDDANSSTYDFKYRDKETDAKYPSTNLDPRDNVSNRLAQQFYKEHGVEKVVEAIEISKPKCATEVMTTRYCLRRELGCCLRDNKNADANRHKFIAPLTISSGKHIFRLEFDCERCEMKVIANSDSKRS